MLISYPCSLVSRSVKHAQRRYLVTRNAACLSVFFRYGNIRGVGMKQRSKIISPLQVAPVGRTRGTFTATRPHSSATRRVWVVVCIGYGRIKVGTRLGYGSIPWLSGTLPKLFHRYGYCEGGDNGLPHLDFFSHYPKVGHIWLTGVGVMALILRISLQKSDKLTLFASLFERRLCPRCRLVVCALSLAARVIW